MAAEGIRLGSEVSLLTISNALLLMATKFEYLQINSPLPLTAILLSSCVKQQRP